MKAEGFSVESIIPSDIRGEAIETGGTEIIVQRHEKYIRSTDDPKTGSLEESAAVRAREHAVEVFESVLNKISQEEWQNVDVLIVGSDTRYHQTGGRRSMETAQEVLDAANDVFNRFNIPLSNILNNSGRFHGDGGVRPTPNIREPKIFSESPDFVKFLEEKYGTGQKFWAAFEGDWEKDKRLETGAEGPQEMADRLANFINVLGRYSEMYHQQNPGRRLVIWSVSHYDTISPYVKTHLANIDLDKYLPVDYGAGLSINVHADGTASTTIGETEIPVPLKTHSTE